MKDSAPLVVDIDGPLSPSGGKRERVYGKVKELFTVELEGPLKDLLAEIELIGHQI